MKNTLIYILTFVAAFILVSWGLIFLNTTYENIFAFNFSPRSTAVPIDSVKVKTPPKQKLVLKARAKLVKPVTDTTTVVIKPQDSVKVEKSREEILVDSLNTLTKLLTEKSKDLKENKKGTAKTEPPSDFSNKKDSTYNVWLKNTSGLFEAMDSKKAAKIIQNYSDNVARDILYSMKKKKSAQIIAELSPEVANRIIRLR
ncbi:MAG: hypothetical protein Q8N03_03290 [Ignavibacteria bacterium]|jgi:flagellar motility protein MotE (MotC chaperone)|nr:hypothetical protein [Ignavibacteria bacterium]